MIPSKAGRRGGHRTLGYVRAKSPRGLGGASGIEICWEAAAWGLGEGPRPSLPIFLIIYLRAGLSGLLSFASPSCRTSGPYGLWYKSNSGFWALRPRAGVSGAVLPHSPQMPSRSWEPFPPPTPALRSYHSRPCSADPTAASGPGEPG